MGSGLFAISGSINGAALCFRLRFCGVDFSGLAPLVATRHTFNGHKQKFLVKDIQRYPFPRHPGADFGKSCKFFQKFFKLFLVVKKNVLPLHSDSGMNPRPGPVPGKDKDNVSNAINGHLQKNASDQNVQKNVWPEILYKGRNDCQLRNSQKFNPVFPFGNRTPDCTTFKVINPGPGKPGPQNQKTIWKRQLQRSNGLLVGQLNRQTPTFAEP